MRLGVQVMSACLVDVFVAGRVAIGRAQPPCYRMQPTTSHILRFKVSNKIYIFVENRDN